MTATLFMPADLTPEEQKNVIKQALKEWLNEQFAAFGKWSLFGILSMAFSALVYIWLLEHGWHK